MEPVTVHPLAVVGMVGVGVGVGSVVGGEVGVVVRVGVGVLVGGVVGVVVVGVGFGLRFLALTVELARVAESEVAFCVAAPEEPDTVLTTPRAEREAVTGEAPAGAAMAKAAAVIAPAATNTPPRRAKPGARRLRLSGTGSPTGVEGGLNMAVPLSNGRQGNRAGMSHDLYR